MKTVTATLLDNNDLSVPYARMAIEHMTDQALIDSIAVIYQRAADDWGSVWKEGLVDWYVEEEDAHLKRVHDFLERHGVEFVSKKDGSSMRRLPEDDLCGCGRDCGPGPGCDD